MNTNMNHICTISKLITLTKSRQHLKDCKYTESIINDLQTGKTLLHKCDEKQKHCSTVGIFTQV